MLCWWCVVVGFLGDSAPDCEWARGKCRISRGEDATCGAMVNDSLWDHLPLHCHIRLPSVRGFNQWRYLVQLWHWPRGAILAYNLYHRPYQLCSAHYVGVPSLELFTSSQPRLFPVPKCCPYCTRYDAVLDPHLPVDKRCVHWVSIGSQHLGCISVYWCNGHSVPWIHLPSPYLAQVSPIQS